MPRKDSDYKGISLKAELVEQIEEFVKQNPQYKGKADFIHEAVRIRMEEIQKAKNQPRFEHFNMGADGARITDRKIGKIADLYFKPNGIYCDLDKTGSCEHIDFALTVPAIQEVIRTRKKEGWTLPDV